MVELKWYLLAHLILGPLGAIIIADDAAHPERWQKQLYRNPAIAIPCCVGGTR